MTFFGLSVLLSASLVVFVSSVRQPEVDGRDVVYGVTRMQTYMFLNATGRDILTFFPNKNMSGNTFLISPAKNESVEGLVFNENFSGIRAETVNVLPTTVANIFPNLIYYRVYACGIAEVAKPNFNNLTKLQTLSLVGNEIKTLDENSFDDLADLRRLELFRNQIEILPENIFLSLRQVMFIELGGNPITSLNAQHFKNNKKLEFLSVRNCRLQFLSSTMFDETKVLLNVDLVGNICIDKKYENFMDNKSEFRNDVKEKCAF